MTPLKQNARRQGLIGSVTEAFIDGRADYSAAKEGRFRRRRTGLAMMGSHADYHYRNESDFWRMLEYARDMDRNDCIVGQMIERATINEIQGGFKLDCKTSDPKLNRDLWQRFEAWAGDADACDIAGEKTFADMEFSASRQTKVDGDIIALPLQSGHLQWREAHRLRTPSSTKRNVVHGVLLDERTRRPLEYWFTNEDVAPMSAISRVSDIHPIAARDGDGQPQVFHLAPPKRMTQTRGVTALAPIFDLCGMFEDINFAKLVQSQVVSCIAFIRELASDARATGTTGMLGPQTTEVVGSMEKLVEEISPGLVLKGRPGETIKGFSPAVPNAEWFQHARMVLQLIGINLGLPLVLLLLDASETNFSGWRGAVDQARMGFRHNQEWLKRRLHAKVYRWKLRLWCAEDAALRKTRERMGDVDFFAHVWHAPKWSYVQPLQDAQAFDVRVKGWQVSHRQAVQETGGDLDVIREENIEDNTATILACLRARNNVLERTGEKVDWHEFLCVPQSNPTAVALAKQASAIVEANSEAVEPTPAGDEPVAPADDDEADSENDDATPPPADGQSIAAAVVVKPKTNRRAKR